MAISEELGSVLDGVLPKRRSLDFARHDSIEIIEFRKELSCRACRDSSLAWIIRDTRIIHPSGAVMAAPCAAKRGDATFASRPGGSRHVFGATRCAKVIYSSTLRVDE